MLEAIMLLSAAVVVDGWQVRMLSLYPGSSLLRALQQLQICNFCLFFKVSFFPNLKLKILVLSML